MPSRFRLQTITYLLLALVLGLHCAASTAHAQDDTTSIDDLSDPIKLFERGQDAQAQSRQVDREKLQQALEFYESAIKLRPEFPEAEYQRGLVLVALGQPAEAEKALRRALEQRPTWALPPASLGALLAQGGRDREAEPLLRRALELDSESQIALPALADVRMRAGDARGALELWKRATSLENVTASQWTGRALAERGAGDRAAALQSVERALILSPRSVPAHLARAELMLDASDYEGALPDLLAVKERAQRDARVALEVARLYGRAGHTKEALGALDALDAEAQKLPEVAAMRTKLAASGLADDSPEARARLEELLKQEPRNAALLARLGALYRTSDPQRAVDYYRRAAEIETGNIDYATGYAAALVQERRFQEAASVLRRIIAAAPQNYEAHANLATALDKLNLYRDALTEYLWLKQSRPDVSVTDFFIARMHDQLGEYPEALAGYEAFLAKADPQKHQFQIDQINLRLPTLRNQIKHGEGVKKPKGKGR